MLTLPPYPMARAIAPQVQAHLREHRASADTAVGSPVAPLPDEGTIEAMIDAAFWASLRREEGYVPRISLAFLPPIDDVSPLAFARPLALDPAALARLAPAVERPGIHLGVWRDGSDLAVWGTTRTIPAFCLVVEVVAPGLLVIKHRPRRESRKFVNIAVLEADRVKIIDESASNVPDCPGLVTSLLGFESGGTRGDSPNVLVQLAVSMRKHGRGGALLVVPAGNESWQTSILQPITYEVQPAYDELARIVSDDTADTHRHEWLDALGRAVEALAGLTAVDGATIITDGYELLAFGAKIHRRRGAEQVEQVIVTEPVEGSVAETVAPSHLGGTRHLSAAQFVRDQPETVALVASQDGRFTIFAWSPCEQMVHAHRVETLLL